MSLPHIEVQDNRKVEEIVHPYEMGNRKIDDRGFTQLAIRSVQFKKLNVADVREGEIVSRNYLTGDIDFKWDSTAERDKKKVVGYVAYFSLVNGYDQTLYMTVEELDKHAMRYSQTYASKNEYVHKNSKWATDFDAMARKTVLKRLLSRYAPLSVDMQTAVQADQSVQRNANEYDYVDNGNNSLNTLNDIAEQVVAEELTNNGNDENN